MASKKVSLASLAAQMQKGFASTDKKFTALAGDLAELKQTLDEHTQTLAEHTRDLNIIKNDVKTNLDKRLTLEVRVTNIEKKNLRRTTRTRAPVAASDKPSPQPAQRPTLPPPSSRAPTPSGIHCIACPATAQLFSKNLPRHEGRSSSNLSRIASRAGNELRVS